VVRRGKTQNILGDSAAYRMVRRRFAKPLSGTAQGAAVQLSDGSSVEFDHLKQSVVEWR
jgi:hypothetical protein